ncbi:MAG: hypothetical protein KBD22_03455 [Candidatus Pacebacteria bacterium]|nr:hypothetical protein [Candidatus Paceibacterota bacterium]
MGVKNIFLNVFAVFSVFVLFFSFFSKTSFAIEPRPESIKIEKTEITSNSITVKVTVIHNDESGMDAGLGCDLVLNVKKATDAEFTKSNEFIDGVNCGSDPVATVKIKNLSPGTAYNIQPVYEEEVAIFGDYWVFEEVPTITETTLPGAVAGGEYVFELIDGHSAFLDQYEGSELSTIQLDSEAEKVGKAGGIFKLKLDSAKNDAGWPTGHYYADWDHAEGADDNDNEIYIGVVYNKSGVKIEEAPYITTDPTGEGVKDNTHLPVYVTFSFGELEFETEYTLKSYYKASNGGDGLGVNAFGSSDESYIEIESLDFKTLAKGQTEVIETLGTTESGTGVEYETGGGPNAGISKVNCGFDPATWDGCFVRWFHSLIYTPSQAVLRIAASLTDALLSFSISSVIYNASTFTETGWEIIRDISNLFFIIILIYVAIGTILGNQKGGVQKIITQLIVVALLINFSLFFTRLIVDASNILARVLYNTMTVEGQPEQAIVQGTGVDTEQKSLSRAIASGLNFEKTISPEILAHPNVNLGYFFLTYLFGTILYLIAAWEFFLIGVMFLQRIMEIWLSMIFAPLAFISNVVPGWSKYFGRVGWKSWLDNLLCWCFIAPIFLFFVMLISAFINSGFLDGLFVAKESGQINLLMFWAAVLMQFMIIIGLLKQARKTAKSMGCETAINFSDYAAKWGKKVGFGAGALALGVASGGAAAIGRNTLGRMGTNVAQSESLKMKSKQSGMSGWVARQQLNTANKLSKSSFDVRKTAAGSGLKNLGFKEAGLVGKATSALGFNESQSDGYKERTEKRKKKEVDFYKELKVDKAGHDKMKEKYGAGLEDFIKNNATKYGYSGGNMSEFKKANSAKFKEAKEKFDILRDEQMYGKYYDKYKKKNDLTYLTDTQKKEALKTVRKDKLETTKGVFEKKNGSDRNLEDINQDRLNAYAEVIEKKRAHIAGAGVKSAGNVGVGGAVVNAAGGLSMAGAGTIGAFAGIPLLEASAKSDAYKQAAEELRDMAKAEGKSKNKREKSEGDVAKKIEKEEKYQEKVKEKLATWERLAEDHDRTAREEMKVKTGKLNIDDPELDGKLEKLMEMNDRKIAEHQLKRDSLAEKAKDFAKKGKSLPEKEHEDFVKAVTEIKKLEKENKDMDGLTENFKKSGERLDNLNEKKGNIGKSTGGGEKKEEPKKDEGKK